MSRRSPLGYGPNAGIDSGSTSMPTARNRSRPATVRTVPSTTLRR